MAWVTLIPLLPALAFLVLLLLPGRVRNELTWMPVVTMLGSLGLSGAALWRVLQTEDFTRPVFEMHWQLAVIGGRPLEMGLGLDGLAASTALMVTIVATCVLVYSLGYMHRDERRGWYFAVVSLFTSAMLALVLSSDLLFTFANWEMMGLCSYLLIGFWYELEAPRKASQKAFLTTRVGDLGFLIALFVIYANNGNFALAEAIEKSAHWLPGAALVASIGLLWAAMGKSAQMPLHAWLPDAMAGPTPASALIHAATMVAAGVFVVARTLPIFEHAPAVMTAMLVIGATTALLAGLMAGVQHDVKKVAAYSTISQLGLMFVALGAGSASAALFHLTTHAFFKSLIFLGAGVIIHAAHTQDMREMGGIARHLPITTTVFTIGALALAGVPPFSGFFSKDEILAILLHEQHYVTFGVVALASGITAFYMARLWFRVFAGPEQMEGLHEGHRTMTIPMVLLAAITVVGGTGSVFYGTLLGEERSWPAVEMVLLSLAIAGTGIGIAWWVYGRRHVVINTHIVKRRMGYAYAALASKLYFDTVYGYVFVRGYFSLTRMASRFDAQVVDGVVNGAARAWGWATQVSETFDKRVVDGAVNGLAALSRSTGTILRKLQTGRLQSYQRLIVGAGLLLTAYFVLMAKGA